MRISFRPGTKNTWPFLKPFQKTAHVSIADLIVLNVHEAKRSKCEGMHVFGETPRQVLLLTT